MLILQILNPLDKDNQNINDLKQHELVQSGLATRDKPSYNPQAYRSCSNKTHLLFLHEVQNYDAIGEAYYHTYEVENGKWSPPQKVSQDSIYSVDITENGLIIYYYNHREGIRTKEFYEPSGLWSREDVLFERSNVTDYLGLSEKESKEFSWWVHDFQMMADGSYYVVWSSSYEETYIVSKISKNGTMVSQPLQGLSGQYYSLRRMTFINSSDQLFLYSHYYDERTILLPNGTWSDWQESGFAKTFASCWEQMCIGDQYLLCYGANISNSETWRTWGLVDLTNEVLVIKKIIFPYSLSSRINYQLDLELNQNGDLILEMALIMNKELELWKYRYDNATWTHIASLNYEIKSAYSSDPFTIDLLREGPYWHVFWDQQVDDSRLHEIYTVYYNSMTDNWSAITQITDTNKITGDYTGGIPGLTFPYT